MEKEDCMGSKPPVTHEEFNAGDSDVTIQSSDGVTFCLHTKNLEVSTGAFPSGSELITQGIVTHLEEKADVLEVVFKFIYPKRHPKLENLEFTLLARIAEAVEKYEIFPAMNLCEIRMREFLPGHASEILVHAIKHDYIQLANKSALALSRCPELVELVSKLPMSCIIPWLQYRESWKQVFQKAIVLIKSTTTYERCYPPDGDLCNMCRCSLITWVTEIKKIDTLPGLKAALKNLEEYPGLGYCTHCKDRGDRQCWYMATVAKACEKEIDAIPSFGDYLNST